MLAPSGWCVRDLPSPVQSTQARAKKWVQSSVVRHPPWVHPDCRAFAPNARICILDPTRVILGGHVTSEKVPRWNRGSYLALRSCVPAHDCGGPAWRHHPPFQAVSVTSHRCRHVIATAALGTHAKCPVRVPSAAAGLVRSSSTTRSSCPLPPPPPPPFASCRAAHLSVELNCPVGRCMRPLPALHYLALPCPPDTFHVPYDYAGFILLGALVLASLFYGALYVVCAPLRTLPSTTQNLRGRPCPCLPQSHISERDWAEHQRVPRNTSLGMLCAGSVCAELTTHVIITHTGSRRPGCSLSAIARTFAAHAFWAVAYVASARVPLDVLRPLRLE
ncbi:hypothetical protein B0H14DRAFT_3469750 [Mycena olivaceomarginata]|nr:hypothetical protein B0H14DRAFT_3469750 [Mycena olivaceomarginata]